MILYELACDLAEIRRDSDEDARRSAFLRVASFKLRTGIIVGYESGNSYEIDRLRALKDLLGCPYTTSLYEWVVGGAVNN